MNDKHFNKVFWFIVGLTSFGAAFTIYLLVIFKGEVAERFGDQMLIFWLSNAVGGGIGYLLGASASNSKITPKPPEAGTTTADISATITTETKDTKKE